MLFTTPCQVTLLLPEKCLLASVMNQNNLGKSAGKTDTLHEIRGYKFRRRDEKHHLFPGMEWCCAALKLWHIRDKVERGLFKYCAMVQLTCEHRGEGLHRIKRTFQPARLHCARQQLEHTILRDQREDSFKFSKM